MLAGLFVAVASLQGSSSDVAAVEGTCAAEAVGVRGHAH